LEIDGRPDPHPLQVVVSDETTGARARADMARFIVEEIRRLLRSGVRFRDDERVLPLRPSDICVLMHSRTDGQPVMDGLEALGLPFVTDTHAGLLETREAGELALVLQAIADPSDHSAVKKALLTRFFCFPQEAQEGFAGLSPADPLYKCLEAWGRQARAGRWPGMFRSILERSGRLLRAAREEAGEATVTTLLDLARELSMLAMREDLDLMSLSRRIHQARKGRGADTVGHGLVRQESDQPKIQIMTMHAAKGLEFPVVFVTGWYGLYGQRSKIARYHHEEREGQGEKDGLQGWTVDLTRSAPAKDQVKVENREEEAHLFYVAATRAKGRVYLPFMTKIPSRQGGVLSQWLKECMERAFPTLKTDPTPGGEMPPHCLIRSAASEGGGGQSLVGDRPIGRPTDPASDAGAQLEPPPARAPVWPSFRMARSSFSSLAHGFAGQQEDDRETLQEGIELLSGGDHAEGGEGPADMTQEGVVPDGKAMTRPVTGRSREPETTPAVGETTAMASQSPRVVSSSAGPMKGETPPSARSWPTDDDLPGGVRTGTLFHALMEYLDYSEVHGAADPEALLAGRNNGPVFERLMKRFPLRRSPDPGDPLRLATLVWRALRTPLPFLGGETLSAMQKRWHEVGFVIPAPGAPAGEFLGTRIVNGFLTGAIDLVVRHDEAYHLIDFKTNWSPDGGYDRPALDAIMAGHAYDLQYKIYAVALRRLLRQPGRKESPSDVAGAGYLFVRGMAGGPDPSGIYHAPLTSAGIDEFERYALKDLLRRSGGKGEPS